MDKELDEEIVEKVACKKHSTSRNALYVRILAAVLAFLMVASLFATILSVLIKK